MMLRRAWLAALLFAAVGLAGRGAIAQSDAAPETKKPTPASDVSTTDGTVDLDERPPDERIEARLQEILWSTERYVELDVVVRDGVVFLNGVAEDDAARTLATDLAQRTAGVAAVVNQLSRAEPPFWTLEPALREVETLLRGGVRLLPLLVAGVAVLLLALLLARTLSRGTARVLGRTTDSELLRDVMRKATFLLVIVIGIYLALRITGMTRIALTVVSGTGLVGLVLGFAFRDIAENFLASLLLSIQRPFRLGDVIEVDGHTGIVRKVTARGTLLIDFDGNHIQIANATVYKNTIKNFSANPLMRLSFAVGIGYDDSIAHAQAVVRAMLDGHPAILNDPEPLVLVEALGASTVNLRVYFWIDGTEHSTMKVQSSVIRLTARALTEAGVSMPDESREVIFPQGVPVRMTDERTPALAERTPAPSASSPPAAPAASADVAVDAEGDLTTETHDLKRQADRSRDPEEGANVLDEGG